MSRLLAILAVFLLVTAALQASVQDAEKLIKTGRHLEALKLLRPLVEADADDVEVLLLTGLAGIGAASAPGLDEETREALLDAAIAALRRILIFHPDRPRPRLELARAFFLKGEDNLARQHFERVLAGKPPDAVVKNVQRYLDAIRSRRRWDAHFGLALSPDSNVNAASSADVVWLYGLPFTVTDESKPSSGVGLIVWGGAEYEHPVSERLKLRAGADLWRQEHRETQYNRMLISLHAGPRWIMTRNTEISLLASRRQHWSANQPAYLEEGLRLESAQRLGAQWLAIERASWHERRNEQSKHLDGPRWNFSLTGRWQASPSLSLSLSAGYGEEKPRLRSHRLTRPWGRLSASYALPLGFSVGASATVARSFYQPDWSYLTRGPAKRKDLTQTYQLSAFNRALTLFGFSPQLVIIQEERKSNAQLHSYQRLRGELRVVRLF